MSLNVQILISGSGTNCVEIAKSALSGELQGLIEITQVISNRPKAQGLEKARALGLNTYVVDHTLYESREAFDQALVTTIAQEPVDLIVLAGFMRKLTSVFVEAFTDKIINIHPSLLPLYPGLNTHQRALAAGDTEHGVTVHKVTEILDDGPILGQASLKIHPEDNEDSLKTRVQAMEYILYPRVIAAIASGKIHEGVVSLKEQDLQKTY